jgi:hypothetical protein
VKPGQLKIAEEAIDTKAQHKKPCADCPWSRKSLPGWTGSISVDEWLVIAHGEGVVECHTMKSTTGSWQCADAAIYRSNVCKSPRSQSILILPRDTKRVFTFGEFKQHHDGKDPLGA